MYIQNGIYVHKIGMPATNFVMEYQTIPSRILSEIPCIMITTITAHEN